MLVSAIIPTYNRVGTIERAVTSALDQTWTPLEIIVVDDGSTDQTQQSLAKFGDRIHLIHQNNRGAGAARNAGIRAASGEIVAFLDSDDTWLPEKIERQVKLLQRTYAAGVRCCIANSQLIRGAGKSVTSFAVADLRPNRREGLWVNPAEVLVTRFLLFNQAAAVWRQTLGEIGCFREDLRVLEDYELALRFSLTGPWAFIADPLVIWHGGEENSLTKSASELDVCVRTREILIELADSPRWGSLLPQKLLQHRLRYLQRCIRAHRTGSAAGIWAGLRHTCMIRFLKLYKAIDHRLPSFPRMGISEAPADNRPQ